MPLAPYSATPAPLPLPLPPLLPPAPAPLLPFICLPARPSYLPPLHTPTFRLRLHALPRTCPMRLAIAAPSMYARVAGWMRRADTFALLTVRAVYTFTTCPAPPCCPWCCVVLRYTFCCSMFMVVIVPILRYFRDSRRTSFTFAAPLPSCRCSCSTRFCSTYDLHFAFVVFYHRAAVARAIFALRLTCVSRFIFWTFSGVYIWCTACSIRISFLMSWSMSDVVVMMPVLLLPLLLLLCPTPISATCWCLRLPRICCCCRGRATFVAVAAPACADGRIAACCCAVPLLFCCYVVAVVVLC